MSQLVRAYLGEKQLYGSRCAEFEEHVGPRFYQRYWVDLAHGFLLRKLEAYEIVDGKPVLSSTTTVPSVIGSSGIWAPALTETSTYWWVGRPAAPPAVRVPVTRRTTITDFRANCEVPPEAFLLEWPIGTDVQDHVRGTEDMIRAVPLSPPTPPVTVPPGAGTTQPGPDTTRPGAGAGREKNGAPNPTK